MTPLIDIALVGIFLGNFLTIGLRSLVSIVKVAAVQGFLLGVIIVSMHGFEWRPLAEALVVVGLKTFVIPAFLFRAMREIKVRREERPFLGIVPSLMLAAAAAGLSLVFSARLPLAPAHASSLLVPASLATVLTGFILLTTRRKAITQVVGYLVLENGIFLFGLLLIDAMPFMVEMGAMLDLFVCVFVMGIILNHIRNEFSTLDSSRLSSLREDL